MQLYLWPPHCIGQLFSQAEKGWGGSKETFQRCLFCYLALVLQFSSNVLYLVTLQILMLITSKMFHNIFILHNYVVFLLLVL